MDTPAGTPRRKLDEAFIREVVALIERNAARWDQSAYRQTGECGDLYCLAGWAVHHAGEDVYQLGRNTTPRAIFWRAAHLLGLSRRQANALFFWPDDERCHPTVDELKHRITEVTGVAFT